jgi:hypothetical protein
VSGPLFERHGAEVAYGGMTVGPIVKSLHIFKDCGASGPLSRIQFLRHTQFVFNVAKKLSTTALSLAPRRATCGLPHPVIQSGLGNHDLPCDLTLTLSTPSAQVHQVLLKFRGETPSRFAHHALPLAVMPGRYPRNQGKITLAGVGLSEFE